MIIKSLFKRYERWNPVHPTAGAFWGIGIGLGCGVGWGPGFGPEVIGYVGAGCGVGFSVGFTLAGFGIGLPANGLIRTTYNAFVISTARSVMLVHNIKNMVEIGRNCIPRHQFNLKPAELTRSIAVLPHRMKKVFLDNTRSAGKQIDQAFKDRRHHPSK
ncbi:hypothetical protein ZOSMA_225G00170 [Zostera marina]|uniref:Cadmium-induced protein AS8 n=1 Tax=Zostera marina TaxID=29655 RepID=A0A0K9PL26_ZOSMR|nr:hypothetical protein ZOSMA_225G00170 [Zostera marina]